MKVSQAEKQMEAYTEAVKSGLYAKKSGLVGKYDNVRKYWEDEITRSFLYPYLLKLIEYKHEKMQRLRILDLGCGSADGFELLTGVRFRDANLHDREVDLLTPEILGLYLGIDLNQDLLDQAREIYGYNPKIQFDIGDFTQGLPEACCGEPFDLYFSSYGTSSHHNQNDTLIQLLAEIAERTEEYSIVVCDWIGRYSYEWQTLWSNDYSDIMNMDYVVSYIYEKEEREARREELQHLNLRLMSREEAEGIVKEAEKESGVKISSSFYYDRSIFTGRHMDTGDYNPQAQPIRLAVNSLHEMNTRTDFSNLIINYVPKKGFDFINENFEYLQMAWNTLVQYTGHLVEAYDEKQEEFVNSPADVPASYPPIMKSLMLRMRRIVEGVGWLTTGQPRENIIEMQLGYALRNLVMALQKGQGCAHGFVGIFEIDKTGRFSRKNKE